MGRSCKGILDPLSDYLEGVAGKKVCKMIDDHLRGCERCRMHVDNMRLVITLYKRWRDDGIPKDVSIRLRDRFAEEARKQAGAKPATKARKAKGVPRDRSAKAPKGKAAAGKSRSRAKGGRKPKSGR